MLPTVSLMYALPPQWVSILSNRGWAEEGDRDIYIPLILLFYNDTIVFNAISETNHTQVKHHQLFSYGLKNF